MVDILLSICKYKEMVEKNILLQIGRNICAERNRLGLSQEGLSELIHISAKHLGKIERGQIDTGISNIIAIMEALDIPFEALYRK